MNLANRLSVLRILLAPAFMGALIYHSAERPYLFPAATLIFLAACFTDGLDGYLARSRGQQTVFGSLIDPIADKLLLLSGFLSLSFMSHLPLESRIPAWVTLPVVTRDLIILVGSAVVYIGTGALRPDPLRIGKITTAVQMATLALCLLKAPSVALYFFFLITLVLTVVSGVRYVGVGGRLLR